MRASIAAPAEEELDQRHVPGARRVRQRHGAEAVARRERRAGREQPAGERLAPGVGGGEQREVQLQRVGLGRDQIELAGALAAGGRLDGGRLDGRRLRDRRRGDQEAGGGDQERSDVAADETHRNSGWRLEQHDFTCHTECRGMAVR